QPELVQLDLADLGSVRDFAAVVTERAESLDGLVNNAGVMAPPRSETVDGFELQLGTNHLGHFALTGLLMDSLAASHDEARVVTVSSTAHKFGSMNFEDLQGSEGYSRWPRYGQSKLANLLFAYELDRRVSAAGWEIRSVAAHPGYASTHLQSSGPGLGGGIASLLNVTVMRVTNLVFAQSDEMGALPSLYAATVPEMPAGGFAGPSGPGEMRGYPKLVGSTRASHSESDAKRLWEMSEKLTGVSYPKLT
ncbi:MAG: oxidoreductase, partial [Solirubrobacterales bacterium]